MGGGPAGGSDVSDSGPLINTVFTGRPELALRYTCRGGFRTACLRLIREVDSLQNGFVKLLRVDTRV